LHFQSQRWQVLSVSSAPWWLPFLWGKTYIPRGQKLQNTRDPKSSKLHTPTHTHTPEALRAALAYPTW
jgi:hypothetical protein